MDRIDKLSMKKKVAKSKGHSPGETNAFVQALPELPQPPAP